MFDRTGRNLILEGFPAWLNKGKRKLKPNEANLKKYLDEMDANTIDSYKTICSFSIFMSLHYDNKVWARLLA
jgi:DNA modification methylase